MAIIGSGDPNTVWQEPEEAAAITRAQTSPGTAAALSGLMTSEPSQFLLRRAERSQYDPSDWFFDMINANAAAAGAAPDQLPQRVQSPQMDPVDYNDKYAPRDDDGKIVPIGDKPMPEGLARVIGRQMKDKRDADSAVQRFQAANGFGTNMLVSMAADMTDPLNVAANLLPGFGEEAIAARLGLGATFAGRTAVRGIAGAALGVATQAPLAAIKLDLAPGENTDFGMGDALKETLGGAASMAAITTGFGSAGDLLKVILGKSPAWHFPTAQAKAVLPEAAPVVTADAATNSAAQRTALGQMLNGKPVDVSDLFAKPPDAATAAGLYTAETADPNFQLRDLLGPDLDRDQIARQLEPDLFDRYDDASMRRAWHSSLYNELATRAAELPPSAATDAGRTALQGELDSLRDEMQSATKKRRAEIAQRIGEITDQLPAEEPAAPTTVGEPLPPATQQPLPEGSIADLDTEIGRLTQKMQTANRAGRDKIAARIQTIKDQQERLAAEIGYPPNAAETVGPERFETPEPERRQGVSPYVAEQTKNRPYSLLEFLADEGGLTDEGGDVRAVLGTDNVRPLQNRFQNRNKSLIVPKGETQPTGEALPFGEEKPSPTSTGSLHRKGQPMSLDTARERAYEEGYFHEDESAYIPGSNFERTGKEPDINDLLNLIDRENRGNPVYSIHALNDMGERDRIVAHNRDIDELAQEHDIDPRGLTREQFFDQIAQRQSFEVMAEHIRSLEEEREAEMGDLHEHLHDLAEGDIIQHPEHGTVMYEGPATLEDLKRVSDEEPAIHAGQTETATSDRQPSAAAGRAGQGEIGHEQNRYADRLAGGVGAQAGGARRAAGSGTTRGVGPTAGDLALVQRGLVSSDLRMRDLAVQVSDAYRRADALIAEKIAQRTGNVLEEIHARQSLEAQRERQGGPDYFRWRHDFKGMLEREQRWRDTGVAPGIDQPDLAQAQSDIKAAATRKDKRQAALDLGEKPPKGFGDPMAETTATKAEAEKAAEKPSAEPTAAEKPEGVTPAPETKQATPAPREGVFDANWMKANFTDKDGALDFTAASDQIGSEIEQALDRGDRVTLHAEGKEIEITNAEKSGDGYRIYDSNGNQWGGMIVTSDRTGRNRFEITPADKNPFPGIDTTQLLPEERAELEAAQAGVEHAEQMQGAYDEAARCLAAE